MIIKDGSILSVTYDAEDEKEILELVNKSAPSLDSKLTFTEIKESSGWTYITAKVNESEFSINYSSVMFDGSVLIKFFAEIINIEEEAVLFLDYEGSYPLLYVKPVDKDKVRFLFADDYDLFANDDIDDYKISDYKIDCDIIIDKKTLLKDLNLFTKKKFYIEFDQFNIRQAKKHLKTIEKYINK